MIPAPCHKTLSWSHTSHPQEITRRRWFVHTLSHVRNQLTRQLTQSASRQQVLHKLTPTYAYQGFTYAHHSYDHLPSYHNICWGVYSVAHMYIDDTLPLSGHLSLSLGSIAGQDTIAHWGWKSLTLKGGKALVDGRPVEPIGMLGGKKIPLTGP